MKANISWCEGVRFTATADSGHTVKVDGPPDLGGTNAGTRPMELMLMSVGSCAATDVVHILRKGRIQVDQCEVEIEADRTDEEPKVFTEIRLNFKVAGNNLKEKQLARAVELSATKYCSASILMQRAGVRVIHSHEVLNSVE